MRHFIWILTLLFVVLKLTNNIDWSWWWVLSPLWINLIIVIAFLWLFTIAAKNFNNLTKG